MTKSTKRPGYVVLGTVFPTKGALSKHCSAILNQGALSLDDEEFLLALLEGHPERDQKIGVGVQRFFVDRDGFGGRCFWLERTDGSSTDFSFKSCITAPVHVNEVRMALRQLVTAQVMAFRDSAFAFTTTVPCAITGQLITTAEAHVDHRPPDQFFVLVERFLAECGVPVDSVAIAPTKDGATAASYWTRRLVRRGANFTALRRCFRS